VPLQVLQEQQQRQQQVLPLAQPRQLLVRSLRRKPERQRKLESKPARQLRLPRTGLPPGQRTNGYS